MYVRPSSSLKVTSLLSMLFPFRTSDLLPRPNLNSQMIHYIFAHHPAHKRAFDQRELKWKRTFHPPSPPFTFTLLDSRPRSFVQQCIGYSYQKGKENHNHRERMMILSWLTKTAGMLDVNVKFHHYRSSTRKTGAIGAIGANGSKWPEVGLPRQMLTSANEGLMRARELPTSTSTSRRFRFRFRFRFRLQNSILIIIIIIIRFYLFTYLIHSRLAGNKCDHLQGDSRIRGSSIYPLIEHPYRTVRSSTSPSVDIIDYHTMSQVSQPQITLYSYWWSECSTTFPPHGLDVASKPYCGMSGCQGVNMLGCPCLGAVRKPEIGRLTWWL